MTTLTVETVLSHADIFYDTHGVHAITGRIATFLDEYGPFTITLGADLSSLVPEHAHHALAENIFSQLVEDGQYRITIERVDTDKDNQ